MSELTESYRRIIAVADPIPNSPITEDNRQIKVLADWGRKVCDKYEAIEKSHRELVRISKGIKKWNDHLPLHIEGLPESTYRGLNQALARAKAISVKKPEKN